MGHQGADDMMITIFCVRPKGFNVGNDAIFLGMQHFLYGAFGHVVNLISLPATSRYESQAKAGLTPNTIYEINQYGHGVIVGGGNLYENGELEVNLDALETLEVPLMLFSLSRGRIYNGQHKLVDRTDAMPQRVVLALNRKAKYSLARDHATGAYLQGIGSGHSEVGGCPTLFVDRMVERLPRLSERDQASVLISVRNPALMSIPLKKQSQVYNDILRIIDFLRREGHRDVRLLCHDHRDIPFAASFTGINYVYTGDVFTYLALLRSCALNVSYRLHAVLPCLAFGTPTIKISYDERAASLIETIGLAAWDINMIASEDPVEDVIDRYRRLEDFRAMRADARPRWDRLYDVTAGAFRRFAADVVAHAAHS
jgi:hypothetical protein